MAYSIIDFFRDIDQVFGSSAQTTYNFNNDVAALAAGTTTSQLNGLFTDRPDFTISGGVTNGSSAKAIPEDVEDPEKNNYFTDLYTDKQAWQDYLDVLQSSNTFNAEQSQLNRDFQLQYRDTNISSIMNQLKENGINPILAFSGGTLPSGLTSSSSGSTASAYSGATPNSNAYQLSKSIVDGLFDTLNSVITAASKFIPSVSNVTTTMK